MGDGSTPVIRRACKRSSEKDWQLEINYFKTRRPVYLNVQCTAQADAVDPFYLSDHRRPVYEI